MFQEKSKNEIWTQPQNLVVFHVATEFPEPMEPDGFFSVFKN
jgi:hypothetical protein